MHGKYFVILLFMLLFISGCTNSEQPSEKTSPAVNEEKTYDILPSTVYIKKYKNAILRITIVNDRGDALYEWIEKDGSTNILNINYVVKEVIENETIPPVYSGKIEALTNIRFSDELILDKGDIIEVPTITESMREAEKEGYIRILEEKIRVNATTIPFKRKYVIFSTNPIWKILYSEINLETGEKLIDNNNAVIYVQDKDGGWNSWIVDEVIPNIRANRYEIYTFGDATYTYELSGIDESGKYVSITKRGEPVEIIRATGDQSISFQKRRCDNKNLLVVIYDLSNRKVVALGSTDDCYGVITF